MVKENKGIQENSTEKAHYGKDTMDMIKLEWNGILASSRLERSTVRWQRKLVAYTGYWSLIYS